MSKALVYQTDFGSSDGAFSTMCGVALKVDPALAIFDLTHVKLLLGISEARLLAEDRNRFSGSVLSYTFHGQDVYAYTGARLASDQLSFEDLGDSIDPASLIELPHVNALLG